MNRCVECQQRADRATAERRRAAQEAAAQKQEQARTEREEREERERPVREAAARHQSAITKARDTAGRARVMVLAGSLGFWLILPVPLLLAGFPYAIYALVQASKVRDPKAVWVAVQAVAIGVAALVALYLVATMSWFD